jgi:hypothetical protein
LKPLKKLLRQRDPSPGTWNIERDDNFPLQTDDPADELLAALQIKAPIRSKPPGAEETGQSEKAERRNPVQDERMAMGIGENTFAERQLIEGNGPMFVRSGDRYERLRKDPVNLAMSSPWPSCNSRARPCN